MTCHDLPITADLSVWAILCTFGANVLIMYLKLKILAAGVLIPATMLSQSTDSTQVAADIEYSATVNAVASSGRFAPYMIGSWNYGRTIAKNQVSLDLEAHRNLDLNRRFSWGAGVEAITGYNHKALYDRFDEASQSWTTHRVGPAPIWLQQLYAEVKYRGVFLTAGMKNQQSHLVDNRLSSGDLVQSNNSRPIAMVTAGFVDFQDIPFTRGWVQIEGCIGYGKFADNDYLRNQYNDFNSHLCTGALYTYKRAYFRTKPTERFSVTIGAQAAGMFGGTTKFYNNGKLMSTYDNPEKIKTFWQMFIPGLDNGDGFVEGSHLGSWDFKARYRLPDGSELSGYFSWFWEDGSSMGKRNKWDGLWGIEWKKPGKGIISGAVIEYVDFRDQSGPMHWAPSDKPGTTITTEATGCDRYYNNSTFNAHANYGMAIGTPFILSPVYNVNGYPQFAQNISRGFHAAAEGNFTPSLDWIVKISYQVARGNGNNSWPCTLHNTSASVAALWHADRLWRGFELGAQMAFDAGSLRGDNFGALVTARYRGSLSFGR